MSNFEIKRYVNADESERLAIQRLKLTKKSIEGNLRVFTGQQGDYYVSIIPTLNVSGYGLTDEISMESVLENLQTLFEDLFELDEVQRRKELIKLGWKFEKIFPKRLSNSFVDEDGVLKNFDFPEKVVVSTLQAA